MEGSRVANVVCHCLGGSHAIQIYGATTSYGREPRRFLARTSCAALASLVSTGGCFLWNVLL